MVKTDASIEEKEAVVNTEEVKPMQKKTTKEGNDSKASTPTKSSTVARKEFTFAVGRRKASVARVRLYTSREVAWGEVVAKKGDILVNGKQITEYFSGAVAKSIYSQPFALTGGLDKFIATVNIVGGGQSGQIDALVHGLSRALSLHDTEKFRPALKKKGLLTRDARIRQRRKVGMGGKSRRKKQSPKR